MMQLYSALLCLTLIALGILGIPFARTKRLCSRHFLLLALCLPIAAGGLYGLTLDPKSLRGWLETGAAHYQLRTQFARLGGIDGAITQIQDALSQQPEDARGWILLGKLYLSKNDLSAAAKAFDRARILTPNDRELFLLQQQTTRH